MASARTGSRPRLAACARGACRRARAGIAARASVRTLLVDNYDSYTFNLYQLIASVSGAEPLVVANDDISIREVRRLAREGAIQNVVVSPGPGTPERAEDVGSVLALLRDLGDVPVLGVCLGHQALAVAHGARVARAPQPIHGRLSGVRHSGHALFHNIPSGHAGGFDVVRYHSLVVLEDTLPPSLSPIAWTDGGDLCLALDTDTARHAPHGAAAGSVLMALAHRERPHFGVQFHPESIATRYGAQLVANFAALTARHLALPPPLPAALPPAADDAMRAQRPPQRAGPTAPRTVSTDAAAQALELLHREVPLAAGVTGAHLMAALGWAGAADTFWLDSSEEDRGRFSFLGGPGGPLWRRMTYTLAPPGSASDDSAAPASGAAEAPHRGSWLGRGAVGGCGTASVQLSDGTRTSERCTLQRWLERFMRQHVLPTDHPVASALPFDFWGGLVGFVGYEMKAECGGSAAHRSGHADAVLSFADRVIVQDHHERSVHVISLFDPSAAGAQGEAEQWVAEACASVSARSLVHDIAAASSSGALAEGGASISQRRQPDRGNGGGRERDAQRAAAGADTHAGSTQVGWGEATRPRADASAPTSAPADCPPGAVVAVSAAGCSDQPAARTFVGDRVSASDLARRADSSHESEPSANGATASSGQGVGAQSATGSGSGALDVPAARASQDCAQPSGGAAAHLNGASTTTRRHTDAAPAADPQRRPAVHGGTLRLARSKPHYLADIQACMDALHRGDSYEVCLTNALRCQALGWDAWAFYQVLREVNPAPHSAWLHCGEGNPIVCCSSPERFLRLSRGGALEARPIKGTAARDPADPARDAAIAAQLAESEKDRAENLMIVDLLRNDLGRVCEAGTVRVPGMMEVESFASVHQLVSTVRGEKRAACSPVEAFFAAFPGGSMTGAPKIRSMEIIDALEGEARGVYSGSVGFFSVNGAFDFNIVIRSAVFHGGEVRIGAGGAIVVQSDAGDEFEEMRLKAQRLLYALETYCGAPMGIDEGTAVPVAA